MIALAARHGAEAFAAGILDRIARHAGDVSDEYAQASPTEHLYLGARRYLDKRAEADSSASRIRTAWRSRREQALAELDGKRVEATVGTGA